MNTILKILVAILLLIAIAYGGLHLMLLGAFVL